MAANKNNSAHPIDEERGQKQSEGGNESAEECRFPNAVLVRQDPRQGREEEGGPDRDGTDERGLRGRILLKKFNEQIASEGDLYLLYHLPFKIN